MSQRSGLNKFGVSIHSKKISTYENNQNKLQNKSVLEIPNTKREFGKDITNIENSKILNSQLDKPVDLKNSILVKPVMKITHKDFKKDNHPSRPRSNLLNETHNLTTSNLDSSRTLNQSTQNNKMDIDSVGGLPINQVDISNPSNKENNPYLLPIVQDIIIKPIEEQAINYPDPQLVDEYLEDIYEHMKLTEFDHSSRFGYMLHQSDINEKMRSILIDWLVEVHLKFKLLPETLFLSVNLIDRYLEKKVVMRNRLQLVGVAAMLIACKYEEIYAPEIRDFVYITDKAYTREDCLQMENDILSTLEFNITTPSSFRFLEIFARFIKIEPNYFMFCRYLLELFLIDYKMLKYNPSLVAASALFIALKISKKYDSSRVSIISGYTEEVLKDTAKDICVILDNVEKSTLQAVRKKYSQSKFLEVAKMKLY